jgi:hypothetical protein
LTIVGVEWNYPNLRCDIVIRGQIGAVALEEHHVSIAVVESGIAGEYECAGRDAVGVRM